MASPDATFTDGKGKTSSELTDELLAELLKKDARNNSLRYSAMGMLPKRPTSAAPKPNTRFLKNILRETDTHNAALKKKEELEARIRLRELAKAEEREKEYNGGRRDVKRRRVEEEPSTYESRRAVKKRYDDGRLRYSDLDEDGRSSKRGVEDSREKPAIEEVRSHRSRGDGGETREYGSSDRRQAETRSRYPRSERRSHSRSHDRGTRHYRRHDRQSRYPSGSDTDLQISRSPSRDRHHLHRSRKHKPQRRSRSESHSSRSRSPSHQSHRSRARGHRRSRSPPPNHRNGNEPRPTDASRSKTASRPSRSSSYSSDPLSPILGPKVPPKLDPTVRSRGRGTLTNSSSKMDMHFNPNYDPITDIQPPSPKATNSNALEGDEWEQALEAHRDRQKWKQMGAERLRAAGFSEGDVKKWESGGERTEDDVRWAVKGEEREWDRGKKGTEFLPAEEK